MKLLDEQYLLRPFGVSAVLCQRSFRQSDCFRRCKYGCCRNLVLLALSQVLKMVSAQFAMGIDPKQECTS
jgi:hypothetical protein